jgi:hypothetical protein
MLFAIVLRLLGVTKATVTHTEAIVPSSFALKGYIMHTQKSVDEVTIRAAMIERDMPFYAAMAALVVVGVGVAVCLSDITIAQRAMQAIMGAF